MSVGLLVSVLLAADPESLVGLSYRAVTFEPGQHRQFRIPQMERVTGASGDCIEETLDSGEMETLSLQSSCAALRTAMVWRRDGSRVNLMVCAESAERSPALVKLRRSVSQALQSAKLKGATACVRNGQVELWGWALTEQELKTVVALERRFGSSVRSHVELVEGAP